MTKMRAVDAAVKILELEGATQTFGLPGAAINPFYDAMRRHGGIKHVLARHVEGASHMAEGYTRARPGATQEGRFLLPRAPVPRAGRLRAGQHRRHGGQLPRQPVLGVPQP